MMKTLVALKLLMCIAFSVTGQAVIPDSIKKELQKHQDNLDFKLELSISNLNKGNIELAEALFLETAEAALKKNNLPVFIKAETNIGRIYADKGENVNALRHYQLALSKSESAHNDQLKAHLYKNIGALYISWKKFEEALDYYEKAEKIALQTNDTELVADCQNNKGTVYEQQAKYDKALVVYKNALNEYTKRNITAKISMALSNVAIVYKYLKNYKASIEYNFKALSLSVKTHDKWIISATYNNIGNLYGEMGDYKKAIAYCEKSIAMAKEINAIEIIESAYDSMSEAAAKAGDYKSAFNYHKLFSSAKDQFINIESTQQLSELNIKYETEKRQKIIQQQEFEISKRNYWIAGSFILLLLGAILAYLIFRNNRYKQQEMATRALFEGEQKERIRIARDLHDSIGQMLSVIKMNISNVQPESVNTIPLATLKLVDDTILEVRNISHNLIPEELNFGLFPALEDLCEKINQTRATLIKLDIPANIREHQFEKANELSIYRIVQEVINNMVKHAGATEIVLTVSQLEQRFTLLVKDNGNGFDPGSISQSDGLGWKNIAARVNILNGKMQIRSEQMTGTQIEISIPKL